MKSQKVFDKLLSCSYLRKPLNHRYLSIPACKFKKFGVFRNLCGVLFNSRGCRTSQLKQLKSYDRRKEFSAFPKCRKKSSSDLSLHFPAHRAASTKQWHERHGVKLFGGWPGNSPDLNPIENLWSQMKHMQRKERATSAEGLKRIARKVWKGVSSDYLKKLYESMPRRMQAVIDAEGGHTKYQA